MESTIVPSEIVAAFRDVLIDFGSGPFQRLALGALTLGLVDVVDGGLVDLAGSDFASMPLPCSGQPIPRRS